MPDELLVAGHAWLEVRELAQAAYLLAKSRRLSQPDFSNFSQTPEDVEGDLRFVGAGVIKGAPCRGSGKATSTIMSLAPSSGPNFQVDDRP